MIIDFYTDFLILLIQLKIVHQYLVDLIQSKVILLCHQYFLRPKQKQDFRIVAKIQKQEEYSEFYQIGRAHV